MNTPYPAPRPPQPPVRTPVRTPVPIVRPLWTYVFLAINVFIFVATTVTGGNRSDIMAAGANIATAVEAGEYWRLFTANFLHASVLHIAFNAYALYALGSQVESLYGHPRFVTLYLLTGLSGAVFSYLFTHGTSVGASTSVFGLFGALVVYFYKNRQLFGQAGRQQLISLGVTLAVNVMLGLSPGSGIDNWGHVGGFIGGLALAWFFCPTYAPADPIVNVFGSVVPQQRKPELANAYMVDTNSLPQQVLPVTVFAIALVALTALAPLWPR